MKKTSKEEVKKYYETHDIKSLKQLAEIFNISENTVKSWKSRDKKNGHDWLQLAPDKLKAVATNLKVAADIKKGIKKAKALVMNGATLKEASENSGVKEKTLQYYSSKENWMKQREEYLNSLYNKMLVDFGQEHIKRRVETIKYLDYIQKRMMKDLTEKETFLLKDDMVVYDRATKIVLETLKGQAELIGLPGLKDVEIIDNEKENDDKEKTITIKVMD